MKRLEKKIYHDRFNKAEEVVVTKCNELKKTMSSLLPSVA